MCSHALIGHTARLHCALPAELCVSLRLSARKQEIIKVTEQLIEAINNGDFEAYT